MKQLYGETCELSKSTLKILKSLEFNVYCNFKVYLKINFLPFFSVQLLVHKQPNHSLKKLLNIQKQTDSFYVTVEMQTFVISQIHFFSNDFPVYEQILNYACLCKKPQFHRSFHP